MKIRIANWNIENGGGESYGWRLKAILKMIEKLNPFPDIIVLPEFQEKSLFPITSKLKEWKFYVPSDPEGILYPNLINGEPENSVLIASKQKISCQPTKLDSLAPEFKRHFHVVKTALPNGEKLNVIGLFCDRQSYRPGGKRANHRNKIIEGIRENLSDFEKSKSLIIGDFDSGPRTGEYKDGKRGKKSHKFQELNSGKWHHAYVEHMKNLGTPIDWSSPNTFEWCYCNKGSSNGESLPDHVFISHALGSSENIVNCEYIHDVKYKPDKKENECLSDHALMVVDLDLS